jgi:hypothetical protein
MAQNTTTPATSASDASVQAMKNTEVTGVNPSGEPIDVVIVVLTAPDK